MSNATAERRIDRDAKLKWVPVGMMRVSPLAQRELNQARVDKIVANFDLEQVGTPTVNRRGGHYFIIDGQHRIEALRAIGWGDQQIQCWTYDGLNESEEAETFLKLNDTLAVNAFSKFRVAVQAGRPDETDIDGIVRAVGLNVSMYDGNGGISAVGTLLRIYHRADGNALKTALIIIRDAYGDAGLTAAVIDGMGYFCQRYEGEFDLAEVNRKLTTARGGVGGLLGDAEKIRLATGNQRGQCVAAAIVDTLNRGKGGKKLTSWWKADTDSLRSVA